MILYVFGIRKDHSFFSKMVFWQDYCIMWWFHVLEKIQENIMVITNEVESTERGSQ